MLLWEAVSFKVHNGIPRILAHDHRPPRIQRLPFDTRCVAITKSGKRCRGKIRKESDFCPFHDPALTAEQRRQNAAKGGSCRNQLAHLPDGYLRKLTNRAAVGQCMDRLYREVRLGIITPEMGSVLFNILCRILDSGLLGSTADSQLPSRRSKADLIRPKLSELLSREEQAAWSQAVTNSPAALFDAEARKHPAQQTERPQTTKANLSKTNEKPISLPLPAASKL